MTRITHWAPINHDKGSCDDPAADGIVGAFSYEDGYTFIAELYHDDGCSWGLIRMWYCDDPETTEYIGDSQTPMTLDEAKQLVEAYINYIIEG